MNLNKVEAQQLDRLMSANGRLLTDDEMIALLDEHKQEHIYQVLPHFNAQHPIFQQVRIIIISLLSLRSCGDELEQC